MDSLQAMVNMAYRNMLEEPPGKVSHSANPQRQKKARNKAKAGRKASRRARRNRR